MASEDLLQQWMTAPPPRKKRAVLKIVLTLSLCALLLAGLLLGMHLPKASSDGFHLVFLQAGKADCTLLVCDGKSVLIDTGNKGFSQRIVKSLHWFGIKKLDAVIITHPHKDHIGSLAELVEKVDIGTVYQNGQKEKSGVYRDTQAALEKTGIPSYVLHRGETIAIGDLHAEVIGPVGNNYAEENDESLVVRFTWRDKTFLFTGDMEAEAESDLLGSGTDLRADVLKVAHHGRNDSTSDAFLAAVKPKIALIPCDEAEQGAEALIPVLSRLEGSGILIWRSDRHGSLHLTIENGEIMTSKIPFLWEWMQD